MHELYELKEKLLKELMDYAENGKFSKEDAEVMKYLSSTIDHICNIVMDMEEDEGYSEMSYERGGDQGGRSARGGSYNRERSYARSGRGRGANARRDRMGRYSGEGYSRANEMDDLVDSIRSMMGDLPQDVQRDAQRFVQKLEQQMM